MRLTSKAYQRAVEFVAFNDEPTLRDAEELVDQLTVVTVAETFQVEAWDVANDVLNVREEWPTVLDVVMRDLEGHGNLESR